MSDDTQGPKDPQPDQLEDDKVGYKNPPKTSRFKKGQSGNPKGRPKVDTRSIAQLFNDVMNEKIPITRNGITEWVPVNEAYLLQLRRSLLEGDEKLMREWRLLAKAVGALKPIEAQKPVGGVLVVPERISVSEWMKRYGKKDDPPDDPSDEST